MSIFAIFASAKMLTSVFEWSVVRLYGIKQIEVKSKIICVEAELKFLW